MFHMGSEVAETLSKKGLRVAERWLGKVRRNITY